MEIIAHRGVHGGEIRENTSDALRACLGSAASGIEIDVRVTSDDICVVHHNTKLHNSARISRLSFDELSKYDADLLMLSEALEILKDFDGLVNLEIKHLFGERDRSRGLACIEQLSADVSHTNSTTQDKILISSFSRSHIKNLSNHNAQLKRAYLLPQPFALNRGLVHANQLGCNSIHFSLHQMKRPAFGDIVNNAHAKDLSVRVYTVNSLDDLMLAKQLHVDGVFTDSVELLANADK